MRFNDADADAHACNNIKILLVPCARDLVPTPLCNKHHSTVLDWMGYGYGVPFVAKLTNLS